MAKSIKVLSPSQDVGAKAFRYITPSAASYALGHRAAFWIVVKKVLGISDITAFHRCMYEMDPAQRQAEKRKALLLAPMPAREVPNTYFKAPPSERNLIGWLAAQKMSVQVSA